MTTEMAIYISMGITTVWAIALTAWALWSKRQETSETTETPKIPKTPDFSFLGYIRSFKMSERQYEQFASSTRMMMYFYAFLAGIASAKGDVSMAVTCGALFVGFQFVLFWVKTKWISK